MARPLCLELGPFMDPAFSWEVGSRIVCGNGKGAKLEVAIGRELSHTEKAECTNALRSLLALVEKTDAENDPASKAIAEKTLKDLIFCFGDFAFRAEKLANGYHPKAYSKVRYENPWLKVGTVLGDFVVGWRSSVISLIWEDLHPTAIERINERHLFKKEQDNGQTILYTSAHAASYWQLKEFITRIFDACSDLPCYSTLIFK